MIDYCFLVEEEKQKEFAYKVYITDALKSINNSVVNMFGGASIVKRYVDFIKFDDVSHKEEKPEEIIERISNKLDKLGGNDVSSI